MRIKKEFLKKAIILCILCLGIFITVLDSTLLNISLPTLVLDFHTSIQKLQWVISIYALILASLTITGGRLGDFYGRKKMFLLGATIFAIGSFITSISHTIPVLIFGESIVEGIGAALMTPATAALIVSTFKGRERAIAFGLWSGFASAAAAVGPLVGGYFTTNYSWRYGFRINILVVLILLIGGSTLLKEYKDKEEKPQLDFVGVGLSIVGLFLLVFGIIESSIYGWWQAKQPFIIFGYSLWNKISICPMAIILGICVLVLFMLWEKKRTKMKKTPLVSIEIFKNWQFSGGIIITFLAYLGFIGISFLIPIFLQSVKGDSALSSALILIAFSLGLFIASQISAYLSKTFHPKHLIQFGLAINGIGLLVLRNFVSLESHMLGMWMGLGVTGIGLGFVMAQLTNVALSAVSVEEAGEASGIFNTVKSIGVSFSTAITGTVFLAAIAANLAFGIAKDPIIVSAEKPGITALVQEKSADVEFGQVGNLSKTISLPVAEEIKNISKVAVTDAARYALLFNFLFVFIAFIFSFTLARNKNIEINRSARK